jgi:hypothetical protein
MLDPEGSTWRQICRLPRLLRGHRFRPGHYYDHRPEVGLQELRPIATQAMSACFFERALSARTDISERYLYSECFITGSYAYDTTELAHQSSLHAKEMYEEKQMI